MITFSFQAFTIFTPNELEVFVFELPGGESSLAVLLVQEYSCLGDVAFELPVKPLDYTHSVGASVFFIVSSVMSVRVSGDEGNRHIANPVVVLQCILVGYVRRSAVDVEHRSMDILEGLNSLARRFQDGGRER